METTFTIRPYGKTELALAYTHGVMSPRSSLNWFNREIAQYPGVLDRLKELGLDVPFATELADRLRKEGVDIPEDVIFMDELADEIGRLESGV